MTVCLDTNIFLQIFGQRQPFYPILKAMLDGKFTLAVSTAVLLEYEEVTTNLSGAQRWQRIVVLHQRLAELHGNVSFVEPQFRFKIITVDPDDDKFCDCAIAANAEFIVTEDHHFDALGTAEYRPKPIAPDEFIHRVLPHFPA